MSCGDTPRFRFSYQLMNSIQWHSSLFTVMQLGHTTSLWVFWPLCKSCFTQNRITHSFNQSLKSRHLSSYSYSSSQVRYYPIIIIIISTTLSIIFIITNSIPRSASGSVFPCKIEVATKPSVMSALNSCNSFKIRFLQTPRRTPFSSRDQLLCFTTSKHSLTSRSKLPDVHSADGGEGR